MNIPPEPVVAGFMEKQQFWALLASTISTSFCGVQEVTYIRNTLKELQIGTQNMHKLIKQWVKK